MDAAQALAELMRISTQVEAAVVLGADGSPAASQPEGSATAEDLAVSARELIAAAGELGAQQDVTRVEVELAEGAMFVLSEGGRTVAARTGPEPSSGLIVYDLRTCLRSIEEEPKRKRGSRKSKGEGKPTTESEPASEAVSEGEPAPPDAEVSEGDSGGAAA